MINSDPTCPFCKIINKQAPARIAFEWGDAIAITPLNPIVAGHLLVIPKRHVVNHGSNPAVTAIAARRFAELCAAVGEPNNMISNMGAEATQSINHLHLHYIPRSADDGVALPWYSGKKKK